MEKSFKRSVKRIKTALAIEILFTISIAGFVIVNICSGLSQNARQSTNEVEKDMKAIISGYVSTFKNMIIPIKDEIEKDPSFDEMQEWMYQKEEEFKETMSEEVYDGIALTYKGGYAHSWDYGDYTDYDPNTRPWYQQAAKANGKVTVVAPYVTFLDPSYFQDDEYILMTIAQKFNDEISFDLDLKLTEIKEMLNSEKLGYAHEKIFMYDANGYILSSTDSEGFAHNVYTADNVISRGYSSLFSQITNNDLDNLMLKNIDGHLQYLYFDRDESGNTVCVIVPFGEVFTKNFLVLGIISLLLILFEIYLFTVNRRNAVEFSERDRRLKVLADEVYKERVYVNIDDMKFFGNATAGGICENGTYEELFELIKSRMLVEKEIPELEEFLSPRALEKNRDNQYVIESKRFMMKMADKEGILRDKTIEVSRLSFTKNKKHMAAIAMQDAEESADLLKEALEAATQASESKGNFLSNMSHEIRTPLNAMIGYLTIAKGDDCTDEKRIYCINNCEAASRHLLQIINDILDMSSIENGKLKIAHEEFDLKKQISDITTIFYQNAKTKNVSFETIIDGLTEEWVIGDELRTNQVLMNLLSNAVKFTPEKGRVTLHVEQLREDDSKVYMRFSVTDTGIGMSKEYMSRIFKPFEQENAGTARKFGGSGLGLSITNNLVHMMGGKIDVSSIPDEGTTFTVTMFFGKSQTEHVNVLPSDYSHVRVLVVDDKEDECSYVKTMLKRCGVKSDTATSGEKALKLVKGRTGGDYSYDMCIIDWNMPDMNGGEVTRRIRKELGEDMPIIIATAYDITSFEGEARKDGATKIIAKPLFQSTLFDLLVSTFGGYDPDAKHEKAKQHIDLSGLHILLAEDNPMNMDIAVTILNKEGIIVEQASNGSEACEKFLSAPAKTFDLILMDVQMPVMDGYEATRQIRNSSHPEAKTIPIIAMTANAFAEDIAEALSKGMNAHIAKPIDYDKLFDVLSSYTKSF